MSDDFLKDVRRTMSCYRKSRLALERRFKSGRGAAKISLGQYTLLAVMDELGESTMGTLAKEMGLSLGGLTGLIDRVIDMGFVERFRIPQDRRIVKVKLTQKGSETLRAILEVEEDFATRVLGSVTSEERQGFVKVLELVVSMELEEEDKLPEVTQ